MKKNTIEEITFTTCFTKYIKTGKIFKLSKKIKILPPVQPSKIIAIGLNYRYHANEMKLKLPKNPILFMKPSTSVIGNNDYIILPNSSKRVDYEGELGIVIKRKCYKINSKVVKKYILGYTCANDVTARDLQGADGQWTRSKSFDTFCPLGPCIETNINPGNLSIKTFLNDKLVQNSNTKNLIFNPHYLVYFISNVMTLLPGDVIITGTPSGIGKVKENDIVSIEIEGIGILKNKVKK